MSPPNGGGVLELPQHPRLSSGSASSKPGEPAGTQVLQGSGWSSESLQPVVMAINYQSEM